MSDLNDLWIPVTQALPDYDHPVILSLKLGNSSQSVVIAGRRTRTDRYGDHYKIPAWGDKDNVLSPMPVDYSNDTYYVEAWQNYPLVYNSRKLSP